MFFRKSLARKLYLPRMLKKWTSFDKMAHTCHVCALTLSFLSWILSFDIHFIHKIAFPYYNNNTTQASVHCVNLSIASHLHEQKRHTKTTNQTFEHQCLAWTYPMQIICMSQRHTKTTYQTLSRYDNFSTQFLESHYLKQNILPPW